MCGQPTSCCRIAFQYDLLINSTNWNTYFLTLNRFIKVTEGHPPGLVIARVPEVWFQDQDLRKKIFQVTSKYVNGPTRLIGVVLVWEEWGKTPHGIAARLLKYEPFVKVSIAEKIPQAVLELWRPPSLSLSYGTFL